MKTVITSRTARVGKDGIRPILLQTGTSEVDSRLTSAKPEPLPHVPLHINWAREEGEGVADRSQRLKLRTGNHPGAASRQPGALATGTEMPSPPGLLEGTRKRGAVPEGRVLTHFRPL